MPFATPFAAMRWQHLSQDSGAERALRTAPTAFASNLSGLSADSIVSSLGFEAAREINLSDGHQIISSVKAEWNHEFGDSDITGSGGYGGLPATYRVVSLERSRDSATVSAQLATRIHQFATSAVDLTAGTDVTFGRRYANYGLKVGLGVTF